MTTTDLFTEIKSLFDAELGSEGYSRWDMEDVLKDRGLDIEYVTTQQIDSHRWSDTMLDVFCRTSDNALVGVTYESPATEYQEGMDQEAEVVRVKALLTLSYSPDCDVINDGDE